MTVLMPSVTPAGIIRLGKPVFVPYAQEARRCSHENPRTRIHRPPGRVLLPASHRPCPGRRWARGRRCVLAHSLAGVAGRGRGRGPRRGAAAHGCAVHDPARVHLSIRGRRSAASAQAGTGRGAAAGRERDAEDSARLRRIASEKEAEKRRRLEGALHYPDRGDAALEDVKGPGAIDIHGIDIHDIDIHDIDIHDIDNYAGALAELARLGAVVASGNGNAKTRRSFVKAMSEVVEGRQRAKERVTKIRGWLSDARTAGVIALPSELLPHDPEATGYSPAVSPRVTAEQLVGVYSVNAQSFPPLFLLPSGVFSQQGPHDGFTQLTLAGRWRLTEDRVELTGFQIFEQDCGPDFLTHTRFHVDLRVEASWPTKPLTPPSPPAEEQPRDRMRLTAIKLGADWRNDERWTDWTDCERASTALIQQAESRLGEAERVVDRCEADRRLEPTVLTDAQVRLVLELTSAAEALARNGLVEEPLQQYAALLSPTSQPCGVPRPSYPGPFPCSPLEAPQQRG